MNRFHTVLTNPLRLIAVLFIFMSLGVHSHHLTAQAQESIEQRSSSPGVRGSNFAQVVPGKHLEYPRDFGSHPEYSTEWWYFTGHLTPKSEEKPRYGFELVFFRVGINSAPQSRSAWAVQSLFLAHFAITDDRHSGFRSYERLKRGSFEEAGADIGRLHVWNGKWFAKEENGVVYLSAEEGDDALSLTLRSQTQPVLQGEAGYSRKGAKPGQASYYVSLPRLEGSGELRVSGEKLPVSTASVWMDQEFTSSDSARAKIGWDWFALQLDQDRELMLYQLRDDNDAISEFSSGTLSQRNTQKQAASTRSLQNHDFSIQVLDWWQSPKTKIRYPSRWKLRVPSIGEELELVPTVADQELITRGSTGVSYWEGRCEVLRRGKPVGYAYVELVGYKEEKK